MSELEKLCKEQGISVEQVEEFLVLIGEMFEEPEEEQ